jgi:soluble cytochrome b562
MTRLACIIMLLFGFGLAACGDDDSDSGDGNSGGDAPSKQEFAKNADQICRNAEKALEQIGEGASSPEDLSAALGKALDRSRAAANELADLERPEGADGETATKFVEGFKQEFEEKLAPAIEDLRDAVEQKDQQAVQDAASKLQSLENTESDKYGREIGADACVGS